MKLYIYFVMCFVCVSYIFTLFRFSYSGGRYCIVLSSRVCWEKGIYVFRRIIFYFVFCVYFFFLFFFFFGLRLYENSCHPKQENKEKNQYMLLILNLNIIYGWWCCCWCVYIFACFFFRFFFFLVWLYNSRFFNVAIQCYIHYCTYGSFYNSKSR